MKMNSSTGVRHGRARGKPRGWAAFDLKQRRGGLSPETEDEPFPVISRGPASSFSSNGRSRILEKPFSSIVLPSDEFPRLVDERTSIRNSKPRESSDGAGRGSAAVEVEKLKEIHHWASEDLIRDIYEALGGSFSNTASLLEGMAIEQSTEAEEEKQTARVRNHLAGILLSDGQVADGVPSLGINAKPGNHDETDAAYELKTRYQDLMYNPEDASGSTAGRSASLPVEPEWEEEDAYMRSRRDALHAMRSASRHSRAASNAFLRGDHSAAQYHSSKAREQWVIAEKFNSEAAREILLLRNGENDIGTLDLHGLHKTEALQALSERLQAIELQPPSNRSVSPNRGTVVHQTSVIPRSSSSECLPSDKPDKPFASRRRPLTLQVITGIGKHSKEQAALPAAVRSFLGENGYHFDDVRPGMIIVRPKYRHHHHR